jgi:hypothetical protein
MPSEALFRAEAHQLRGHLAGLGADWLLIDDVIQAAAAGSMTTGPGR